MQPERLYANTAAFDQSELIERFAPLVQRIAYQLMARLPANVEVDDLVQYGMLGLIDANQRFTPGQGAQFETYAVQRVRGAMLDGLRDNDWLPRSARQSMRRLDAALHVLQNALGRQPSESEIAAHLQLSLPDYHALLRKAHGHPLVHLEDLAEHEDEGFLDRQLGETRTNPIEILEDQDLRTRLVKAIAALPEREKLVMGLYYSDELNLREIGAVLGVSESRVCQLHGQAVARLRASVLEGDDSRMSVRRGRPPKTPSRPEDIG
ncbi:MAG: RNA polymerase sigma factor FliA [Sphingobacteriia bacterium]|nr:RNA polymerase sigma factor FliA [Sphingobacteriia bacterium]NCC38985.1 RNA polymerase sigma factor FliA [Gammaproteobacteria bacterium]